MKLFKKKPFLARKIHGHSMMPILPPGTTIVGFRWFKKLKPGNVIIFWHEGREKIKRIERITEDNRLYLLGEHSIVSTDSRHFGTIEPRNVIAKVIWPSVTPRE